MTAALEPEDIEDLRAYIRVQIAAGYAPAAEVIDEAVDVFADTTLAPDALRTAASLAKVWCSEVCFAACAENIQIHGGVGFTWEHDAHLFFRRAKSSEILLGDGTWHRDRLATAIGLEARS